MSPALKFRFVDSSEQHLAAWRDGQEIYAKGSIHHLRLSPLRPGRTYRYQWFNPENGKVMAEHQLQTVSAIGNLDVFLGSCADLSGSPFEHKPIFESLARHAQQDQTEHLMLWLGDSLYFRPDDLASASNMLARYQKQRAFPGIAALLPAMPNYAIWDDWDFGGNDSDRRFAGRQHSRDVFRAMWPIPEGSEGDISGQGMYYRFVRGDVEFFMMDDRTYRDADLSPNRPEKSMFGARQMEWLQQGLLHSRARYKVIASGSTLLNGVRGNEGWHHFQHERQAFFNWLMQQTVPGIVLVSGDAHHTRLTVNNNVASQPIYELTCSPLSSQVEPYQVPTLMTGQKNLLLINQNNYCQLEFRQSQHGQLNLSVSVWNENGQRVASHALFSF